MGDGGGRDLVRWFGAWYGFLGKRASPIRTESEEPVRFDERQSTITVVALPDDNSKPISVASKATVKSEVTGRTVGMGASAFSVLGDWFPTEDTAKDIIINKER